MDKLKLILFTCLYLFGVSVSYSQTDSLTLTYNEYIENIIQFHPIARKANLQLKWAEAEKQAAKGTLDPILSSNWNQKDFDDKLYYRIYQGKLKFPTPIGVDISAGYVNTEGDFINPQNVTDPYGLWFIGIEANLLQGLITNDRRAALQQAKIFQDLAENQKQILLNELIYNASMSYLQWQKFHYFQQILEENLAISNTYFQNTKISQQHGEKSTMDTLEAFIAYQDAINLLQKNKVTLIKARQNLENYLWFNNLPVTLQDSTLPESLSSTVFPFETNLNIDELADNNPLILASINKQSVLEIEQKLKREKLKPKLKVKYNPLISTSSNSVAPNYSFYDYTWGFDFSMSLLLRSERAGVRKGEIKLQEIDLEIQDKRNELKNRIESSLQQQAVLSEQVSVFEQNVNGYKQLLDGENEEFKYGESSVFLLNQRQERYINGQLKLIELNVKLQMERLNYLYYSNKLIG